jgi:outer membrane immunogenic protein
MRSLKRNEPDWISGLEWMLLSNWSAKVEYLHYDLGSLSYPTGGYSAVFNGGSFGGTGTATIATSTTDHFRGDIVRVGVNYRFRTGGLQMN